VTSPELRLLLLTYVVEILEAELLVLEDAERPLLLSLRGSAVELAKETEDEELLLWSATYSLPPVFKATELLLASETSPCEPALLPSTPAVELQRDVPESREVVLLPAPDVARSAEPDDEEKRSLLLVDEEKLDDMGSKIGYAESVPLVHVRDKLPDTS
jgi:hypothetical protein